MYETGKGAALTKIRTDTLIYEQGNVFNRPAATKDEIIVVGEKYLLCLYNCSSDERAWLAKFCQKVATGTTFVQPESLPPTSAAAAYQSEVILQIKKKWKGVLLEPDLPPAHESLLEVVIYNCSTRFNTERCTCKKHRLDC